MSAVSQSQLTKSQPQTAAYCNCSIAPYWPITGIIYVFACMCVCAWCTSTI